jgi:hypothetical protein
MSIPTGETFLSPLVVSLSLNRVAQARMVFQAIKADLVNVRRLAVDLNTLHNC